MTTAKKTAKPKAKAASKTKKKTAPKNNTKRTRESFSVATRKIGTMTGFKPREVEMVKRVVAKNTTDSELFLFLEVCKQHELNPFLKEVWCYKDHRGNLIIFVGRDGHLKRAKASGFWDGWSFGSIRSNDTFTVNTADGKVSHIVNGISIEDRGPVKGAYCTGRAKGADKVTTILVDFDTYNRAPKQGNAQNAWNTHPDDMIIKCAQAKWLHFTFPLSGVQNEHEWNIIENVAVPVDHASSEIDVAVKKITEGFNTYQGENKETLRQICKDKYKNNEFTMAFAEQIASEIGVDLGTS